jgi:Domain of unknown function (DUF4190)
MIADQYLLLWKGRQFGPFSMDQIREKLSAGDINRMHQIQVEGRWQILDEYLEKLRGKDLELRRAEQQTRDAELKRQKDAQLHEERSRLSHLMPNVSPPSQLPGAQPGQNVEAPPGSGAAQPPFPTSPTQTSPFAITTLALGLLNGGLAAAALAAGLDNFIPLVSLVLWIVTLLFGHIALSQMNTDDSLEGRGMAIAGLAITYFLLVTATTVVVLLVANNKPMPFHF